MKNEGVGVCESFLSLDHNFALLRRELEDIFLFDTIDVDGEGGLDGWILLDFDTHEGSFFLQFEENRSSLGLGLVERDF